MSKRINGTTITTFQGDSFSLTFTDLTPGDTICFSVRDKKYNKPVFDELTETVDNEGEVTFSVTAEMTNKFSVKPEEKCAVYYYGLKLVDDETGEEHTILLVEEPAFEDMYIIKVLLKKAEGCKNG